MRFASSLLHGRRHPEPVEGPAEASAHTLCEERPAISGPKHQGYAPQECGKDASPPRSLLRTAGPSWREKHDACQPFARYSASQACRVRQAPAPASPSALFTGPLTLSLSKGNPHSPRGGCSRIHMKSIRRVLLAPLGAETSFTPRWSSFSVPVDGHRQKVPLWRKCAYRLDMAAKQQAPPKISPTPMPMALTRSRSSRALMRCASGRACISAIPTMDRACTTWCSRCRTTPSTRRWRGIATSC